MINKQFEEYKVMRELKRSGTAFTFLREQKNEFGETEDNDTPSILGTLTGLYHETNGYVKTTTSDATQIQSKKIPMILCLYSDITRLCLQVGDTILLNDKTFKITGITNIQEWNTIGDISLEVVL